MAGIELRLQAFVKLGEFFRDYVNYTEATDVEAGTTGFEKLDATLLQASLENGWFTRENILFALESWGQLLKENSLRSWLSKYKLNNISPKNTALITAGNIPMVGFHDLLSVVITGNKATVKCATNDRRLLPFIVEFLIAEEPSIKGHINFTDGILSDFDAVIATGSNNTARYFEYYFGKKLHIIRNNRNSVAVLTGDESHKELTLLGEDIFRYYGLGCRSVSKIFVPEAYNFDSLFNALIDYQDVLEQQKYLNNYEYNKAVYLMSNFPFLDNGFFMLKEDPGYASPIATLFYETYDQLEVLKEKLVADKDSIQCVVSKGFSKDEVSFGQTQQPGLSDYADGIDTVEFLLRT